MFWNRNVEKERLIDYVMKEAIEDNRFAISCFDDLIKRSNNLLSILLSGGGGGLALAIALKNSNAEEWLLFATSVVVIYLFVISGVLFVKCLWVGFVYSGWNDPKNLLLFEKTKSTYEIKREELDNKQSYIDKNMQRNELIAKWLNITMSMAILTPAIFIFSAVVYYLC